MYKVLIPQDINQAGKTYLKKHGYKIVVGKNWDTETIKREIMDSHAVIARTEKYPAEVIAAGKNLKIIARYGVGTDNIDVKAAEELGVIVTITKGANKQSVAEHTIALLLACAKNLIYCDKECRKGNWNVRNSVSGVELKGKKLGLIGLGDIGLAVAKKAHFGFEMEILGYDPYLDAKDLPDYIEVVQTIDDIFTKSDFISVHVPLTSQTKHMIDKELLEKMKPTAYLINCSRGGIVNESDLYEVLKNNRIAGAAMDVFEIEPATKDNPLFTLDNFIASPHNAGLTKEAAEAVALSAAKAVHYVLSGRKPEYPINNPSRKNIQGKGEEK